VEQFVKGDIVVVPFPFSNLSDAKRRPALVLANLDGNDIILCQITSVARNDQYAIPLDNSDYLNGNLSTKSFVRPNKIFTADKGIILYIACQLRPKKTQEVINKIVDILM
jgi:mRNA interferase MazF